MQAVIDTPAAAGAPPAGNGAYAAIVARDARFDGRLFVGVTSTGIYCRPVCRVRTPQERNCRFFANAASAEDAGFRPCLRCRPELAPGLSLVDSSSVLAHHAAAMLQHAARHGEPAPLPAIAQRLGVTERHLRRIFGEAHGVAPITFLTTQRLLLAKQLLTDTDMPVAQVALACGFESLRRFNAVFAQRCRLSPSALRREAPRGAKALLRLPGVRDCDALKLRLGYRPPFDIAGLMHFFAMRALPGIERVEAGILRRTLAWQEGGRLMAGWVAMQFLPERNEVDVMVSPSLAARLGRVVEAVRQALDLDADPQRIDAVLQALPVPLRPGLRLPGSFDGFETSVRVILGQQVTVAAARTLTKRLVDRFGQRIETPFADLDRLFPDAATLAAAPADEIGQLGIVRQRVGALQALAAAVHEGRIALHRAAPLEATLAALHALPGIGEWTVQMIAMRALAWPDAMPASDIGLLNALGTRDPRQALALSETWRPWRAYAVIRLWHELDPTPCEPV